MPFRTSIHVGENIILYRWPEHMGTLSTVGDAIRQVEELGYHITYISDHPAHTTRRKRESLLDTPHLYCGKCNSYYTLQKVEVLKDLVTTVLKVDRGIRVKLAGEIIHGMRVIEGTHIKQ